MTLTRSKGLTFRAAIIIGVEDEVIPSGRPVAHEEEERRLLYVGITRAREFCYLTMAKYFTDATAMSGGGQMQSSRSRSRFMSLINVRPIDGDTYTGAQGKGHDGQ
jgi:superfamily I DNA/RNA helicase